jgi:chorismate mutase
MLDQTTERIVSRLKDRSRFPLNMKVYKAGAIHISGRRKISLLQFAVEGIEAYHASLGRYEYKDQQPLFLKSPCRSRIKRANTYVNIYTHGTEGIAEEVLAFYTGMLPRLCKPGDKPDTYGETAYVDADLIELLHERINTAGRYAAQFKLNSDPRIKKYAMNLSNYGKLETLLRNQRREDVVVRKAVRAARLYGLDPYITSHIFKWLIEKTVSVELTYINGIAMASGGI